MGARSRVQLAALLGCMAVSAAACGQHPGVVNEPVPLSAQGGVQEGLVDSDGDGLADTVAGDSGSLGGSPTKLAGGGGGGAGAAGGGGGTNGGGATGGGGGSNGGGAAPSGGDATGVTASTIKIGLHAPITGAAPVPQASFEKGKDLYWRYLASQKKTIQGRDVQVVSRNDNYNPSQAVAVCREMVEEEKVFLLFGLAGTDQIAACARYAASAGVPYLSAGVTESGLTTLRNYFALWMSYKQQAPLLVDMMVSKLGARGEKNAMVRFNTPSFQDAHDSWVSAMKSAGAPVSFDQAVPKTAGAGDAQSVATQLNQAGIKNVYVLTSPSWFIQLANAAAQQGYKPQWVGVGITMGLDTVANVACRNQNSVDGARFFHPVPAFIDSSRFDPAFRQAGGTDDIMFGLWGGAKATGALLSLPGKDLTRERFVYFAERAQNLKTGVLPPLSFSTTDHFGGSAMHLLRAVCSQNRYVTEQSFVSNF